MVLAQELLRTHQDRVARRLESVRKYERQLKTLLEEQERTVQASERTMENIDTILAMLREVRDNHQGALASALLT